MNPPCVLDANDFCTRHGRKHLGPIKALALDESERGSKARAHWDAGGTVNYGGQRVSLALVPVPEFVKEERLAICHECTHWNARLESCTHPEAVAKSDCASCKKYQTNASVRAAKCPIGKWGVWSFTEAGLSWNETTQTWEPETKGIADVLPQ